jgi:hypothetical protein
VTATSDSLRLPRDLLRALLFLLIVVSISRAHAYIGLAPFRPAFVLVAVALTYAFIHPRALNQGALRTWPARVVAGLGVVACASVPFGMSIGGSAMFIISQYSKVLVFAFLLMVAIRDSRDLLLFIWAYVLSCAILIVLSVVVGLSKEVGLVTYDSNDTALILLIGLPLAIITFQTSGKLWGKVFSVFVVLGTGATLAISASRGGLVGLVAVGAAMLVLLKHIPFRVRFGSVLLVAAGLFLTAPDDYWESMRSILSPTEDYNWTDTYGRREVARRGMGYMLSHPLTGIGVGNFGRAEGDMAEQARDVWGSGRIKWSAAHNSFMEAGAEMGIFGFLLFCSLVFGGIVAMHRLRRRLPRSWARGDPESRFLYDVPLFLEIALVAFATCGSFLSFAYREPVYVLAALMVGLYASLETRKKRVPRPVRMMPAVRLPPPGFRTPSPVAQQSSAASGG